MDAAAWDARYASAGLVWTAEPNRFVVAEVEDLPPGRALDLACGEGRNAVWLAERGWDRSVGWLFIAMAIGHFVILAMGWAWLAFGVGLGIGKALIVGVTPFLVGALLTVTTSLLAAHVWRGTRPVAEAF